MATNLKVIPSTRDEWSLYSLAGADAAAANLGKLLAEKLTKAILEDRTDLASAVEIRDEMYHEMTSFEELGARDTEPECVLVETIEKAFGIRKGALDR